jgi:hypothetical protein
MVIWHVIRFNKLKMRHVFLVLVCTAFAQLYTFDNSNVVLINGGNFDSQITKKRDKTTSVVHFYK